MDETILLNYLQGECNDEEAARVETWCEEEPGNRKTLEQLYYTLFVGERIAVMNAIDTEASLDKFKSAIREKEKKTKRKNISIRWGRYATVAAAFLAGLVFAGGIAWGLLSNKLSDYEVITAAGQRAQTVLPDGSRVWLNASSKLVYHNSFWSSDRQIDLSGEAYFEVAKDSGKPFQVEMNGASITVLGTHFNVKADAESDDITATLVEGSIRFEGAKQNIVMTPNQQLTFSRSTNKVDVKQIDTDTFTAWKDGLLKYKSIPFTKLIENLKDMYQVEIRIDDERLADPSVTVSGTFDQRQSFDQILKVISYSLPVRWTNHDGVYHIQYATLKR